MSDSIERVGYVGLGIMGAPMAKNLLQSGFSVTVWNRTLEKCEPLRELGAAVGRSPADVASQVDVVCINVTDTPDVEAVLFGEAGIASGARKGLMVIDHSTISPLATRDFAARLQSRGITMLDAPVSGGDVGAQQATLSIMVGGPPEVYERCRAVFEAVGRSIVHVGDNGAGQLCKACNQIAGMCALMGVVEAIALAEAGGLDVMKMLDVVKAGAAGSWQMANLGPKIAQRDWSPGFMIDLVLKDLAIASHNARQLGLSLPGIEQARAYFQQSADLRAGRDGTQAMAKALGLQ